MPANNYRLISFKLCPYVQRSVITLLEKQIPFERIDISLKDKPSWFLEISPTGKVPVLLVDDASPVFESAVICEYINETTENSLLSADPLARARQRSWIEFASAMLNHISGLYRAASKAVFEQARARLQEDFRRLEQEILLPYFSGSEFSMVDCAFAPVFRYFDLFDRIPDLRMTEHFNKVSQWRSNLASRPSVIQAVSADYVDALKDFIADIDSVLGARFKEAEAVIL